MQSQELAARLGIDPSAMSNIERGRRSVKTQELMKIAEALSVSPWRCLTKPHSQRACSSLHDVMSYRASRQKHTHACWHYPSFMSF